MFFSDKGGLDFAKAEIASEEGCVYIYDTDGSCYVVSPQSLEFEGFSDDYRWSYFILNLKKLAPVFGEYQDLDREILVEDVPGHYVNASAAQYGVYDYDSGEPFPKGYKVVNRFYQGTFLIVLKIGPYNHISSTYDGRHAMCSSDVFRDYIVNTGLRLVIAEKPSVAQSIARVIGADQRKDGYLEGNGYLVSWCIGHLVELAMPETYNEAFTKWKYEDLPILPQFMDSGWQYQVADATKKQFGILKKLMHRDDVISLICATDAAREGELIYRLVYQQAGCKKPFDRLWISSMEDEAIREGFTSLKAGSEYDALYEAALCRERADWIVGINATRLFSCLYRQSLNVGRVMTPTLAMVVLRDAEITAFRPQPFYTVQLDLGGITADSRRFMAKEEAEALLSRCKESMGAVVKAADRKEKNEKAPLLYDLTSLQRDANRILGYTAQQTLDYVQSLYEKKLVTYPRTDSRFLTEDMKSSLPSLVSDVAKKYGVRDLLENPFVNSGLHVDVVCDNRRVTDHHAIIPTKTMCSSNLKELPTGENAVLQLIVARLLCALADPHIYAEESIVLTCGNEEFTKTIKTVLQNGWKEIQLHFYPVKEKQKDVYSGPALSTNMTVPFSQISIKSGETSPPKRFTEDTLLSAMQAAGAEEMSDEVERKGLGTPATRAGIIEKLVRTGLIIRQGDKKTKYLTATDKGISLITVMPEQIQSPSMTADWEMKLLQIERGAYSPTSFMDEITEMIRSLVQNYKAVEGADVLMNGKNVIGRCPHCGAEVIERKNGWFCSDQICKFALWKDNAFFNSIGKALTPSLAEKLLKDGKLFLKNCKSRKSDRTYNATVILGSEDDGKACFKLEFQQKSSDKKKRGDS